MYEMWKCWSNLCGILCALALLMISVSALQMASKRKHKETKERPRQAVQTDKAYTNWKKAVDKELQQRVCSTWKELSGNEDPLLDSYRSKETPEEFVDSIVNRYNLVEVTQAWGRSRRP